MIEVRFKFDVKKFVATIYMIQSGSKLYHTAFAEDEDLEVIFRAIDHCITQLSKVLNVPGTSKITISYV